MNRRLTAIIAREGDGYVGFCPAMDVVSQGDTVAEARGNLEEAVTLFFETASEEEIADRVRDEVYVVHFEVVVGSAGVARGHAKGVRSTLRAAARCNRGRR